MKQLSVFLTALLITFFVYAVTCSSTTDKKDIKWDYKVDLKQDYYIILSDYGSLDTVAVGELEEFFFDDNL